MIQEQIGEEDERRGRNRGRVSNRGREGEEEGIREEEVEGKNRGRRKGGEGTGEEEGEGKQ